MQLLFAGILLLGMLVFWIVCFRRHNRIFADQEEIIMQAQDENKRVAAELDNLYAIFHESNGQINIENSNTGKLIVRFQELDNFMRIEVFSAKDARYGIAIAELLRLEGEDDYYRVKTFMIEPGREKVGYTLLREILLITQNSLLIIGQGFDFTGLQYFIDSGEVKTRNEGEITKLMAGAILANIR